MGYYTTLNNLSPYGWWKLHETSGSTVYNTVTASNETITNTTGVTRNSTAPSQYTETGNYAYAFDNSNICYVTLSNTRYGADMENNNACTWTVIGAIDASNGQINIVRHNADSSGYRFAVYVSGGTYWLYAFVNSYFNTEFNKDTGISYSAGAYHHFAITYSNNGWKGYVDGTEKCSQTLSNYTWQATTAGIVNLFSTFNGGYDQTRQAKIDDIACWRSTLTGSNISSLATDSGFASKSASVSATVTDIDITGKPSSVSIVESNTADVSNININGQNVTVTAVQNVEVENSPNDIEIIGHNPILQIQSGVQIPIDVSSIILDAKEANYSISDTVNAQVTNIALDALNALGLYPSLVFDKDPVHYFRFINQQQTNSIVDYGSVPIYGTCYNLNPANDCVDGIFGDPESKAIQLDGVAGSSAQGMTFFATNIFNTNNLLSLNATIEFWIKTSSPDLVIFGMDGPDGTNNKRSAYIGLNNGQLCWAYSITDSPESWNFTNSGTYLDDGEWHHVVLTKSYDPIAKTFTNKSYVDLEETPVVISLYAFLGSSTGAYGNNEMIGSYPMNTGDYVAKPFTYSMVLDEIAMYSTVLSEDDIWSHYYAGMGIADAEIEVEVSDIQIEGIVPGSSVLIFAEKTNVDTEFKGIILNPGAGSFFVIPTHPNIKVKSSNSTVSKTGGLSIPHQVGNIKVNQTNTRTRTKDIYFKFISAQDTALSANDAQTLESLDFGGLLFNQTKKLLFRIGNEESNPISYEVNITSKEDGVANAVKLSKDNITYASSIIIEQVPPNFITDVIYVKLDVNQLDVLGNGTFLINVERYND